MREDYLNTIYILDSTPLKDGAVFELWYSRMKPERQAAIDKFKVEGGKRLSLAAGILLEKAMTLAGAADYELELRGRGKPYIKGREDLFFNISHSGDLAILGLSDTDLGVDVERRRTINDRLKRHAFLPEELTPATEEAADEQLYLLKLWTAKEAVMKFYGLGIAMEAKSINLCRIEEERNIKISSFIYKENYVISVCSGDVISFSIKEVTI